MSSADDAVPSGHPAGPAPRTVCVVVHDVATSTRAACARTMAAVKDVAGEIPFTLLAVPRYHGETPSSDFEAWLSERQKRGDELALHGDTHRDEGSARGWIDRLRRTRYTRGEGEFWALSRGEALARIDSGIAWFAGQRWPLAGFVAPAWLLGEGARQAVALRPFEYTSTLHQMIHLPSRHALRSQSVVYSTSSEWRRQASCLWNGVVARLERGNPLLRIELHPRDADFVAVRRSWQRILERALRDRQPATVVDFMRRTRPADATQAPSTAFLTTTTAD